jgi:phosphoadenosine phosphosulfate reductase
VTARPQEVAALHPGELEDARRALEGATAAEVLSWVDARFGASAALASSFADEDLVLIDLAATHAPRLRLFTLDTGRLPPETYEVMEAVRERYGARIEAYFPERAAVERLEREKGYFSFRQSLEARKECCGLRKLEPLGRALQGRLAWVTGLRREQAQTRAQTQVLERDEQNGLLKVNPLALWTEGEVQRYVRQHGLPRSALYGRGYTSIGCAPCTRAIEPGDDVRAGRWWWEAPEHKECGLHDRLRRQRASASGEAAREQEAAAGEAKAKPAATQDAAAEGGAR